MSARRGTVLLVAAAVAAALACDLNKDVTKQCRQAASDAACASCCKDNGASHSRFGGAMGTCNCEP